MLLGVSTVFRTVVATAHLAAAGDLSVDLNQKVSYGQFSLRGERLHGFTFDVSDISERNKGRVELVHAMKKWMVEKDIPVLTSYSQLDVDADDTSLPDIYAALEGNNFDPPPVMSRIHTDRSGNAKNFTLFLTNGDLARVEQALAQKGLSPRNEGGRTPVGGGGRGR